QSGWRIAAPHWKRGMRRFCLLRRREGREGNGGAQLVCAQCNGSAQAALREGGDHGVVNHRAHSEHRELRSAVRLTTGGQAVCLAGRSAEMLTTARRKTHNEKEEPTEMSTTELTENTE